jgi:Sec-independent protein secretion pathway component TatC
MNEHERRVFIQAVIISAIIFVLGMIVGGMFMHVLLGNR